ncbi:MAG: peptidoglycan-associated lipoprotein Pal [Pseudomonadota bacterium]
MRTLITVSMISAFTLTLGCSGAKQAATPAQNTVAQVKAPVAPKKKEAVMARAETNDEVVDYTPIFFDYDSWQLNKEARGRLDTMAKALQHNPDLKLTIEGHCDERGTTEYNIALGERRAQVTRDYLKTVGVAPAQLAIMSYGKERPMVKGTGEQAWAKNRRSQFVPVEKRKPTASL